VVFGEEVRAVLGKVGATLAIRHERTHRLLAYGGDSGPKKTRLMKNRNMLIIVSGAAFVLGLGAWFLRRSEPAIVHNAPPSSLSSAKTETPEAPAGIPADDEHAKSTVRPAMRGAGGRINTYGKRLEEVMVQYWAEMFDFEITNEELALAQEAYTSVTNARRKLEDRIAEVERLEPTRSRIMIPAYPETGEKLKQQFENSLVSVLGTFRAQTFLDKIEVSFNREGFGWGMMEQIIDVKGIAEWEHYEVAHGFGLPDEKVGNAVLRFSGVSGSTLSPNDLDIYSHLARHFPPLSTN
jgi:hypothetical protein